MLNDDNWHPAPVGLFRLANRVVARFKSDELVLYPELTSTEDASDLLYRTSFYFPDHRIYYAASGDFPLERPAYLAAGIVLSRHLTRVSSARLLWMLLTLKHGLITSSTGLSRLLRRLHRLSNIDYVDRRRYRGEAAAYHHAYAETRRDVRPSRQLDFARLPKREFAIIFGSGPSLDTAYEYDFDRVSAYKVVCNSVVKNRKLLDHIRPDFIVCADAALHFGPSIYSSAFRADLVSYLEHNPGCKLLIPETYAAYFHDRVYAGANFYSIPCLIDKSFNVDLRARYAVHDHGSILNRLQLPLASALSDRVLLLGYDGRSERDRQTQLQYWAATSADNNYTELMSTLFDAHPFLGSIDKDAYASQIADKTNTILSLGEQAGKEYYCLNQSSIPALQSRTAPASLRQRFTRSDLDVVP